MYKSCLLVASSELKRRCLASLFAFASDQVSQKLFLTFPHAPRNVDYWKRAVVACYSTASEICPSLDFALILPTTGMYTPHLKFDFVLTHPGWIEKFAVRDEALRFNPSYHGDVLFTPNVPEDNQPMTASSATAEHLYSRFSHLCLGGTFDSLHNGHKILLSTGALLASECLLVGVTGNSMLKRKSLAPLIQTYDVRCQVLDAFLTNIGLSRSMIEFAELSDPYGPPAHRSEFSCIVCSVESEPSCLQLNELRRNKGWQPLVIEKIDFVTASAGSVPENLFDGKISSSSLRYSRLGHLLRATRSTSELGHRYTYPYIVGLAGPAGSGKSSMAHRLAALDNSIHVIDCDRLGHKAYEPGTDCHRKLLDRFGADQIAQPEPPHHIDRARLGKLVFSDENNLAQLNQLVWPEIKRQVFTILDELEQSGNCTGCQRSIAVLDAAVLFQAQWDRFCNEVWVTILPRDEAIRRICERNQLPEDAARDRLDRQSSAIASSTGGLDFWSPGQLHGDVGPVARANVVLSTQWEPGYSEAQIARAYAELIERVHQDTG